MMYFSFPGNANTQSKETEDELARSSGILTNMTASQIGPTYRIEKTASLKILGPQFYNIKEGEELALICRDEDRGDTGHLMWRRKVYIDRGDTGYFMWRYL